MAVNLRKFMQLIVFFAHHDAVKPLGKTKLFKLLYFTDATHLETAGQSITGAEYLKYSYGPVPTQGDYALKELQKHRIIRQQRIQITPKRFRRDITALQMSDMTIFTTQERQTIQHVIQQYGEDSAGSSVMEEPSGVCMAFCGGLATVKTETSAAEDRSRRKECCGDCLG